jgi:putative membrane protein
MAASEPVDETALRRGRRTHPLTGLVQGGLWAGAAIAAIGASYLQGDRWDGVPWWLALLLVVGGGLVLGEVAGFASWYATRYVVDDTEVRLDTGILTRRSRRAAFERIQAVDVAEPFLARLAGLAEVRVDLAGGDESRLVLRFLPASEARAMRALLLRRAHGAAPDEGADEDPDVVDRADEELITRVTPQRTLLGAVLSLDLLAAFGVLGLLVLAALGLDEPLVLLGGLVPVVSWAARLVARRVVAEWGFTLWRTPHGLRIERGLLSLTAQTIPFARVQGVAVVEPLLWRRLGWCRLDVDVAGRGTGEDAERETTLLPIADRALAAALVDELVPEVGEDETGAGTPVVRASARSWPFAPIGWRYRWLRPGRFRATSSTGWVHRTTSHAPHAKVQSIALRQGPVQRWRGVATLEVHSPDGPVDVDLHHVASDAAWPTLVSVQGRARAARPSAAAGRVLGGGVDTADELP